MKLQVHMHQSDSLAHGTALLTHAQGPYLHIHTSLYT